MRLIILGWLGSLLVSTALHAGTTVYGRLADPEGFPISEAVVTLARDGQIAASAVTAGDGTFILRAVPEGTYIVAAAPRGQQPSLPLRSLEVRNESPAPIDLRMTEPFTDHLTVLGPRILSEPSRIPGSISILDRHALETSRPFSTSEVLRKTAGVVVRDEEGLGLRPNIGLRGLSPTRSTKVLLLEDGVPLAYAPYGDNSSYYHPPIERYESVELLKGSGQIAFGPATVSGVINYVTPAPPADSQITVRVAGGTRDFRNAHVTVGGTWGKTGVLLDLMRKESDGSRENLHSDLSDVSAKIVHELSAAQNLTLRGSWYREDSNVTYSGLRLDEFLADPRQNPFRNDFFYGDRHGLSLAHRARLAQDVVLTTTLYGARFQRHWWRQSSNSGQRPNDAGDPRCGGMANLLTTCGNEGRLRRYYTFGLEPRLRSVRPLFGLRSDLQAGVRLHLEDQERRQVNGDTPTSRSGRVVENNARDNRALSGFLQNTFSFGKWSVTPGVRVEHVEFQRTNRLANNGAGAAGDTTLTQVVPGLGISWLHEGTTVFAGVHRGFAPPRTEDIINNSGGVVDLDSELSWNYELGVRSYFRPGLSAAATLFRMDYENQIVPASVSGGAGATLTNAGETGHEGLELEGRVDSAALLETAHNLYLSLAYTNLWRAEFTGVRTSGISGFSGVNIAGNRLPYAPRHLVTAGAGYMTPGGLELFLEGVHVSAQFADDLNTVASTADGQRGLLPGYTVWNASVNYDVPQWKSTFFVAVKNVLDELYIADRSRGILPGTPRMVQAGVIYRR